jgi:ligand-binding sensor domain-containing protein/signal transduction histidine kinase
MILLLIVCAPLSIAAARAPLAAAPGSGANHLLIIDGREIRFSQVSGAGLSQTRVTLIAQDNQGFMWFGTQYGLDRYDGYTVRVFKNDPNDTNTLSGTYIYALLKDRSGALWVSCFNSLDRLDPATEKVVHFQIDPQHVSGSSATVFHISQDHTGNLWLATANGLFRFDPATGRSTRFSHSATNPQGLSDNQIKFTGEDRAGTLWVASAAGLDAFDPRSETVTRHIPLSEPRELSFFEDSHGRFWIARASTSTIALLDRVTGSLTEYSFADETRAKGPLTGVIALLEDRSGNLWLGTASDGILRFDVDARRFIRYRNHPGDPASLTENRVTALYEDREGDVWVGLGASSPNFFPQHPLPFEPIQHQASNLANLGEHLVNALLEDSHGTLWAGTTGGLESIDRATGQSRDYEIPGHGVASDVLSIVEDPHGLLWLATSGEGLYSLDSATGRIKSFRHRSGDGSSLSSDDVLRLFIDHAGTLWATTSDGLDRYDTRSQTFMTFRGEGNATYWPIAEDAAGRLWIGSYYGLQNFDPGTGRFEAHLQIGLAHKSLVDERINDIYISSANDIWIASQNGLTRLDSQSRAATTYYEHDGLGGNAVACVLEDAQHHLWMSTNHGISSFDPVTRHFDNYTESDGLPGDDMTGWGACYKSPRGELYFGGFAGAAAFYPQRLGAETYVPPIVLTEFEWSAADVHKAGQSPLQLPIGATRRLTLSHQQSTFSIGFSALSYRNPRANRYRYMLVGLDHDWHQVPSDRRLASYTALGAGHYEFRVQGATGRGPWNEPGAMLQITILPPWWQTWWFKGLLAVALALVILALYYYRIQRIAEQFNIRLEERIGERTRIARELHDSFLQGFQGLLLRLQAARNLLPGQMGQAIEAIDTVLDRGDQVIAESRLAVDDMRSSTTAGDDLVQTLKSLGEELSGTTAMDRLPAYRLVVIGKTRALDGVVRDEVYRIAREALRNAFHHSQAREVEAEVTFGDVSFVLRVRDNGVGIENTVLLKGGRPGHWGLPGMRERAQAMGGRAEFWSEKGAGTEIELMIPASIAYGRAPASRHFVKKRKPR